MASLGKVELEPKKPAKKGAPIKERQRIHGPIFVEDIEQNGYCFVCDSQANPTCPLNHLDGMRHKANLILLKHNRPPISVDEFSLDILPREEMKLLEQGKFNWLPTVENLVHFQACIVCKKEFNLTTAEQARSHLRGKGHKEALQKIRNQHGEFPFLDSKEVPQHTEDEADEFTSDEEAGDDTMQFESVKFRYNTDSAVQQEFPSNLCKPIVIQRGGYTFTTKRKLLYPQKFLADKEALQADKNNVSIQLATNPRCQLINRYKGRIYIPVCGSNPVTIQYDIENSSSTAHKLLAVGTVENSNQRTPERVQEPTIVSYVPCVLQFGGFRPIEISFECPTSKRLIGESVDLLVIFRFETFEVVRELQLQLISAAHFANLAQKQQSSSQIGVNLNNAISPPAVSANPNDPPPVPKFNKFADLVDEEDEGREEGQTARKHTKPAPSTIHSGGYSFL